MANEKILIMEDDKEIATLIGDYLRASGYQPIIANDGEKALEISETENIELAILDIIVPKVDGFEVCRQLRANSSLPILMVSSKKEDTDKILALGLGADDYIEKPFSPRVLVAKVQSQLRRSKELSSPVNEEKLKAGDLVLDLKAHTVSLKEELVNLSVKEFEILHYLMLNRNQALSREKIFDEIWGFNEFGDINTVTVHIRKIREKIELTPS